MSNVATNIKLIRTAAQMPCKEIAAALGMSERGYQHMESGNTKIDVERLQVIARALDTDVEVFFDDNKTIEVIGKIVHRLQQEAKEAI